MVLFSEMYASKLKRVAVVDRIQEPVGKVKDLVITITEPYPVVSGLLITTNAGKEYIILMAEIDMIGQQFVATRTTKDRIPFTNHRNHELYAFRDIFDKQIVDINGARVIRVNDLKLAKVEQSVNLIAVDVGARGLLRRIGIEGLVDWLLGLFKITIPERLIGWDHVEQFQTGSHLGPITIPHNRITELHPADVANIISQVHSEEKTAIFKSLSDKTAAEALHELEPKIQAMLLLTIDTKKALRIIEKMPVDEIADVLGDLPQEKANELLRLLGPRKMQKVKELLSHPEETAGGLMTTEFISVPLHFSVEDTILKLREVAPDAETIYYVYVLDNDEKLIGVFSLRELIIAQPQVKISQIMTTNLKTVDSDDNQKEVADIISKYNLFSVPVVDKNNKMLGIVTVDDVVDFILPPISRRKRHILG
ncbi:MAG: CBS domain-containing protein [Candidatus Margulisbacteria bacterium]|nr:CBS domain-containing protein [Candidatus Margulisiibacteriota bacterium]MBU1728684.1 CBS domain-containing protein [Candidatus Margulisiibacteriota bacterium]MBU1955135.1 CBS domain-containing protein [Candidatus Margulisiibacteriota bacterium]